MYVAAIDQGTTSTRCMIFDHNGSVVAFDQKEHQQIYPEPGWVEHDAQEIWGKTIGVIATALVKAKLTRKDIAAVGVTNQRETTVIWDKTTGRPVDNAIVWQDTRTDAIVKKLANPKDGGQDRFRKQTGLPLATYFSGPKIKWLLDENPMLKKRAQAGTLLFGTMDSWIIWNLTGGVKGGVHVTDVTNASRTMLMNLKTLDWDADILKVMGIPREMLPEIRSSSEIYGSCIETSQGASLSGVPLAGALGDQQAALFGQACFNVGDTKNTYGTGCFMLMNTGANPIQSKNGLITTIGYKLGKQPVTFALEGSVAIAGALVQWLRDNLGVISNSAEVEDLAKSVEDTGGIYFVPAFSGLYAPHWKDNARGVLVGMTRFTNKYHIARATLEATAYQTREVLEAMNKDTGTKLKSLKVDGGMTNNETLMQFQSDVLGVPVVRPNVSETTSLGAAYAAGLAVGFWKDQKELAANWAAAKEWKPEMKKPQAEKMFTGWKKAVTRSFDWAE